MRMEYDFRIKDRDAGTFVIEDDGAELRQTVSFETDDGARYDNRYHIRYVGTRVMAYRVGDGDWVDCAALPRDHAPTAAYPLLIRGRVASYIAIDEESGEGSPRELEHVDDRVVERENGVVVRTFDVRDGVVARIDWGGAVSTLQTGRRPRQHIP